MNHRALVVVCQKIFDSYSSGTGRVRILRKQRGRGGVAQNVTSRFLCHLRVYAWPFIYSSFMPNSANGNFHVANRERNVNLHVSREKSRYLGDRPYRLHPRLRVQTIATHTALLPPTWERTHNNNERTKSDGLYGLSVREFFPDREFFRESIDRVPSRCWRGWTHDLYRITRQYIFVQSFCSQAKKADSVAVKEKGLSMKRVGKGKERKRDPFALFETNLSEWLIRISYPK